MILSSKGSVGNGVGNGGCRFPFTPSQWQELEHQALIFKYIVSGVQIPPELLFTLKTTPSSHLGWSCFQMGLGFGMRKIDPEPGRCRRTDGKKWRCSKEAFQESKYCEKHMHRGKNRSRKHVEQQQQQQCQSQQHVFTTPSTTMVKPMKHYSSSHDHHHHHQNNNKNNHLYHYDGDYSNMHSYHQSTQLGLHSGVERRVVDEGSWGLSTSKMSGRMSSATTTKQQNQQVYHHQPPYFQFQGFEEYETSRTCGDEYDDENGRRTRGEKTVYRFLEECPPDNNNNNSNKDSPGSWLNNLDDNKSSNCSSSSTTQLSISIPTSTTSSSNTSHHHQLFPMFNSSNF